MCARSDPKYGDKIVRRPGLVPLHRPCTDCGVDLLVAPSTAAMEARITVVYKCNPCSKAEIAVRGVNKFGIAPGALRSPEDARRRNELEAHGFRDITPDEL